MAWLLDTDICSYVLKAKPPHIAKRLFSKSPSQVMVSAITVYELITGCEKSPARERLLMDVGAFLAPLSSLAFTAEDAHRAGVVRAALERKGTPIGAYDILIAGQALARDLILVTHNSREFRRVKGLKLEDWSA